MEKTVETKTVIRLDARQYQALEKKVGHLGISHETTQLEVAFQLGVQHVLKAVREGFVFGEAVINP